MTDNSWINTIDYLNLVTILDVLLDIKHESDLKNSSVIVSIMSPIIRFPELMPADTILLRNNYLQNRWSSFKFLEIEKVIRGS